MCRWGESISAQSPGRAGQATCLREDLERGGRAGRKQLTTVSLPSLCVIGTYSQEVGYGLPRAQTSKAQRPLTPPRPHPRPRPAPAPPPPPPPPGSSPLVVHKLTLVYCTTLVVIFGGAACGCVVKLWGQSEVALFLAWELPVAVYISEEGSWLSWATSKRLRAV